MMTREEVLAKVDERRGQGWDAFPYDEPERGIQGYIVSRVIAQDTREPLRFTDGKWRRKDLSVVPIEDERDEETEVFQWATFGDILVPDDQIVSTADELAAMLRADPTALSLDDPRQRLIGFIWFKPSEKTSVVRRLPLTKIRGGGDAAKAIMEYREKARIDAGHTAQP